MFPLSLLIGYTGNEDLNAFGSYIICTLNVMPAVGYCVPNFKNYTQVGAGKLSQAVTGRGLAGNH